MSLEFSDALSGARYREFHKRTVNLPIDQVWPHCIDVAADDVRAIGPLFALRGLPARLKGKPPPQASGPESLLDVFRTAGFVVLRQDEEPADGRAVVIFGAAGKFWSLAHNTPLHFESPASFLDFDEPGWAKTICRLEAIDQRDGTTRIETETWVDGTDAESTKKFGPYWAIIRLPSGLIRRSWLAAIDRRASSVS